MRRLVLLLFLAALVLPGAAAAGSPGFALWDLQTDLSHASRNVYGDVTVKPRAALAGHGTAVECGTSCRFGAGWLAFSAKSRLGAGDVSGAKAGYSKRQGWVVRLTLRPAGAAKWTRFSRNVAEGAKLRGVPDVLVIVADGTIAASPFSTQVSTASGTLTLTGFSRASAKLLARQF